MIITNKAIPRRTILRGIGASLALPFLDSMVPAFGAAASAAAVPVRRFGVVYVPNGMVMKNWTPEAEGAAFELTPILKPLEPFRDDLLVLTGLSSNPPVGGLGGEGWRTVEADEGRFWLNVGELVYVRVVPGESTGRIGFRD